MKGQLMKPDESIQNTSHTDSIQETNSATTISAQAKSVAQVEAPAPDLKAPGVPWHKALLTRLALLVAAAMSAFLLSAGHFPLAWGWAAWMALVPLLFLVRTEVSRDWVFFCSWICGLSFYLPSLSWLPLADDMNYILWPLLAVYCSLYLMVGIWLLRVLDKRLPIPLTVSVPVVWASLEFLRSFLMTGFAWYYLGHTQHDLLPLIQIADLGGVYTITFLVAMVNGLIAEWLYLLPPVRSVFRLSEPEPKPWGERVFARQVQTGVAFLLIVATFGYGVWRLSENDFARGPKVALVQGSVPQNVRNEASSGSQEAREAQKQIIHDYFKLSLLASGLDPQKPPQKQSPIDGPDLTIWPETSFPEIWLDYTPHKTLENGELPENLLPDAWRKSQLTLQKFLSNMAAQHCQTNLLLGVTSEIWKLPAEKSKWYNSALLVRKDGSIGTRYDKVHRVPFGEFMPLRDFPLMKMLAPHDFDYGIDVGEGLTRFQLGEYHFGVLICYEDTDPFLARQFGTDHPDGPPVDFLVNMSNDGWFDGSCEHNEHLAICRFRAIEARKAVARSVNMGISAIIDSNGRVLKPELSQDSDRNKKYPDVHFWNVSSQFSQASSLPLSEWNQFKKTQGVLTSSIPIDTRVSLYSQWGDWFASLCWVGMLTGVVCAIFIRKKTQTQ